MKKNVWTRCKISSHYCLIFLIIAFIYKQYPFFQMMSMMAAAVVHMISTRAPTVQQIE